MVIMNYVWYYHGCYVPLCFKEGSFNLFSIADTILVKFDSSMLNHFQLMDVFLLPTAPD